MTKEIKKKPPNLDTLPLELTNRLFLGLDFAAIQSIRKVSHCLRDYINESSIEANLYDLTISGEPNIINLELKGKSFDNSLVIKKVEYKGHVDGCFVTCGSKKKFLENKNYADTSISDLISILKHHNGVINHFHVEIPYADPKCQAYMEDFEKFMTQLKAYLEGRAAKLKVKRFHMEITQLEQLLGIYKQLDAKFLERTSICKFSGKAKLAMFHKYGNDFEKYEKEQPLDITELIVLEQWKQCQDIFIDDYVMTVPLSNFLHVIKGSIHVATVSLRDLELVRDTIITSDPFREFTLRFQNIDRPREIEQQFGEWDLQEDGEKIAWFPLPKGSKRHVLQVTFVPKEQFCFTFL